MTTTSPAAAKRVLNFGALMAIAQKIETLDQACQSAWKTFKDEKDMAQLKKLLVQLNAAIEPHIVEIALATGNSESTVRQCYQPKSDLDTWFTTQSVSEFLRKVSKYESFNDDYWKSCEKAESCAVWKERAAKSLTGQVVSVEKAVEQLSRGEVPHLRKDDCPSRSERLSAFDRALLAKGILMPYAAHLDQSKVSPVSDFAYFVHSGTDDHAEMTLQFWPAHRSRHHIETIEISACEATTEDAVENGAEQPQAN